MSDNMVHRLTGTTQQFDALSGDLSRTNLSTSKPHSSMNTRMGQEDEYVRRSAIDQIVEIEVQRQISESAGLKDVRDRLENLENEISDAQIKESPSPEINLHERLSKVVNEFQNCVPIIIGSLAWLLTIGFPCNTLKFFIVLIISGCCVLFLLGGLATFWIWTISKDVVYEPVNRLRKMYLSKGGGETNENSAHKSDTLWCVWPHLMRLMLLVFFSLMFATSVAILVSSKTCVKPEAAAVAPAPVDEHWPGFLGYEII